jgi:hypothetical protein
MRKQRETLLVECHCIGESKSQISLLAFCCISTPSSMIERIVSKLFPVLDISLTVSSQHTTKFSCDIQCLGMMHSITLDMMQTERN